MKELTIQEKAERYDKSLERASNLHKDAVEMENNMVTKTCEVIFPELVESEDESIRKNLIELLLDTPSQDIISHHLELSKVLSWLEKQGKETSWKPSKEEMDALYGLAYITNQYDEHKEKVITRLYQDLKREFFNGSSYENMFPNTEDGVRRRSTIQVLEYARSLDTYNQYGKADIDKNIAWLEKQCEQKPFDYDIKEALRTEYEKGRIDAIAEMQVAWNEEDEINYDYALAACIYYGKAKGYTDTETHQKTNNWLKSLKERVGCEVNCTTKKEWSEEDEYNFAFIKEALLGLDGDDFYREKCCKMADWLESLKDKFVDFDKGFNVGFSAAKHNQWKPSDEQIYWLKWAIDRMPDTEKANEAEAVLEDLLEQLKKL